jgi:hypothetical protein
VGSLTEADEVLQQRQKDEYKRYFYTLVIQQSKQIKRSIPQGRTLKTLHQKCTELNIPMSQWENFIRAEL